jgi:RNA 2',3'-cyclic 3'-phosphodiesterase
MRTFVALNLPAVERQRVHDALLPLHDRSLPVGWTAPDAMHLTLKFIGDIEGAEVAQLDTTLRDIAGRHDPVELRLGGLAAFPSLRRASVLWVGIAEDAALMALQADIELALSRLGYPREQRPFRPHLTVARTRGNARPPDIERFIGGFTYTGSVTVDSVDLMRSHLGGGGARYEPLLRAPLRRVPGATSGSGPDANSGREPDAGLGREPDATSGREPDATSGREPGGTSGREPDATSGGEAGA